MKKKDKLKVTKGDIKVMIYQFVAAILMFFSIILYRTHQINTALPQHVILAIGLFVIIVRIKK